MHFDSIFPLQKYINISSYIFGELFFVLRKCLITVPGQIISTYLVEVLSALGLDLSKFCKSVFLDRYTKVVSIFYLWNMESNPNSNIRRVFLIDTSKYCIICAWPSQSVYKKQADQLFFFIRELKIETEFSGQAFISGPYLKQEARIRLKDRKKISDRFLDRTGFTGKTLFCRVCFLSFSHVLPSCLK